MFAMIKSLFVGTFSGYASTWPKLPPQSFGDSFFTPAKPDGKTVLSAK